MTFRPRRAGFSFIEITIAVVIAVVCAIPIVSMISSTRADSSKAINYLRGLELANEAIEWAALTPATQLEAFRGSYSDDWANSINTVTEPRWQRVITQPLGYCIPHTIHGTAAPVNLTEQYQKAYFRRDIVVSDQPSTDCAYPTKTLQSVEVTVSWNEAKVPIGSERMRKIALSTLMFNDRLIDY